MRLRLAATVILVFFALPSGVASARDSVTEITLSETQIVTSVGRVVTIESRIVNHNDGPSAPMLAHINVVSSDGSYVDLEDWSPDVTRKVPALTPGEDTTLSWDLQAVNAGRFHVYVVLVPDSGPLVASGSTRVEVGQKRELNAGGILPVAIAVPFIVGIGAAAIRNRTRHRTA
jgi:hypothetical protein